MEIDGQAKIIPPSIFTASIHFVIVSTALCDVRDVHCKFLTPARNSSSTSSGLIRLFAPLYARILLSFPNGVMRMTESAVVSSLVKMQASRFTLAFTRSSLAMCPVASSPNLPIYAVCKPMFPRFAATFAALPPGVYLTDETLSFDEYSIAVYILTVSGSCASIISKRNTSWTDMMISTQHEPMQAISIVFFDKFFTTKITRKWKEGLKNVGIH